MDYPILTFMLVMLIIVFPFSTTAAHYFGNYLLSIGFITFSYLIYASGNPECELGCILAVGVLILPALILILLGLCFRYIHFKTTKDCIRL